MKFCRNLCCFLLTAALCAAPAGALTLPAPPVPVTRSSLESKAASTPAETLELALKALKTLDVAAFNRYTDNQDGTHSVILWGEGISATEQEKALAAETFRALSWTLGAVQVNGSTATVAAKITNSDLRGFANDMAARALRGELNQDSEKVITEAIRAAQKTLYTHEVAVTLNKADGSWKVHLDDKLVNALMGGLLGGIDNLFSNGILDGILEDMTGDASQWMDLGLSIAREAMKDADVQKEIEEAIKDAGIAGEVRRALADADISGEISRALREAFR